MYSGTCPRLQSPDPSFSAFSVANVTVLTKQDIRYCLLLLVPWVSSTNHTTGPHVERPTPRKYSLLIQTRSDECRNYSFSFGTATPAAIRLLSLLAPLSQAEISGLQPLLFCPCIPKTRGAKGRFMLLPSLHRRHQRMHV